jgi:hypothetical protein
MAGDIGGRLSPQPPRRDISYESASEGDRLIHAREIRGAVA